MCPTHHQAELKICCKMNTSSTQIVTWLQESMGISRLMFLVLLQLFIIANKKSETHWCLANFEAPTVLLEVCHVLQWRNIKKNHLNLLWETAALFALCFYICTFPALMYCTKLYRNTELYETDYSSHNCVRCNLKYRCILWKYFTM